MPRKQAGAVATNAYKHIQCASYVLLISYVLLMNDIIWLAGI